MKRLSLILVILILALALALSSCSDPVCQHRDADDDSLCDKCGEEYTDGKDVDLEGFEFTLKSDGTYEVSDYEGDASSVTVPARYNGKAVSSIAGWSFAWCKELTEISIPSSVTEIGKWAFSYSGALVSIKVDPENPSYKDIDGNLYTKDGTTLLKYAPGKTETTFTTPSGLLIIESQAAENCNNLVSVVISEGVTDIKYNAFADCTSLESVEISKSVTSISNDTFAGCTSLTSISVDPANTQYNDIDGDLYRRSGKELIQYAVGKTATSFTVPDSVTNIEWYAFNNCESLTEIIIGKNVENIGTSAFSSCSSLVNIKIAPENPSYKDIDGNLYTKDGATLIKYASGKTETSFTTPIGVTEVGNWSFEESMNLTSVVISDGVERIGLWAFRACENVTSIDIPNSMTLLDDNSLYGCTSLKSINYQGTEEEWNALTKGDSWDSDCGEYTVNYNYKG